MELETIEVFLKRAEQSCDPNSAGLFAIAYALLEINASILCVAGALDDIADTIPLEE